MASSTNRSPSYGVKYQSRCISAVSAERERSRFLLGTLSLKEENEVHLVEYKEGLNEIVCEGLYSHQHEIWDLAACPFDTRLFTTVYSTGQECGAAVWRLPPPGRAYSGQVPAAPQLEQMVELKGHQAPIKCVLWHPSSTKRGMLISVDEETLRVWTLDESRKAAEAKATASAGELQQMAGGCCDPHDSNAVATASDCSVDCWDLRTMKRVQKLEQAHAMQVRDLDYNPRRQHVLLTAGDDSRLRFWDLRSTGAPLLELSGHNHWVWRARYNKLYDELVLSAGTDTAVNLWHVPTVSSLTSKEARPSSPSSQQQKPKPYPSTPQESESPRGPLDELAHAYNEHEDSIYGIAWSAKDPFCFASLSYDGRVVVDSVPQQTRKRLSRR